MGFTGRKGSKKGSQKGLYLRKDFRERHLEGIEFDLRKDFRERHLEGIEFIVPKYLVRYRVSLGKNGT